MPLSLLEMVGFHLGSEPSDIDRASLEATGRVLGRTCGIVRDCRLLSESETLPGLTTYVARGPVRPCWSSVAPVEGTGLSTEPMAAFAAAVAEAVESYCWAAPPSEVSLTTACFTELGDDAVAPERFAWPSPAQYEQLSRIRPLTRDRIIDWSVTWSLTRQQPVFVPSALIFPERGRLPPNEILPELTSTGVACHVSLPRAILGGLCEVLERDAFAITWYNRLPLTPLDIDIAAVRDLLSGLSCSGLSFRLFSVPTISPFPVVLCVATCEGASPHVAVGLACRPDAGMAAAKAVYESCQSVMRLRVSLPGGRHHSPSGDGAAYYATVEGAQLFASQIETGSEIRPLTSLHTASTGEVISDLTAAVATLGDIGLEVLVGEMTTADVASTGYRVVRVLIPGAVCLSTDARSAQFGGRRIYSVPMHLGLRSEPSSEPELVRLPAPLA